MINGNYEINMKINIFAMNKTEIKQYIKVGTEHSKRDVRKIY